MPGPLGNVNSMRNGSRLAGYRLKIGELPPALVRQTRDARKYRRELEAAVAEAKGEVDLIAAHAIDTAAAAVVHASICRWLLRERIDRMATSDILACSTAMLRAKETRDRAVARLGLDRRDLDTLDALYSPATPPHIAPAPPNGQAAANHTSPPPDAPNASVRGDAPEDDDD
jgi:hypothetical protein